MIVDIVKNAINAMGVPPSFFDAEKWEQNFVMDSQVTFPIALLDHPINGKDKILPQGNQETTFPLVMFFANKMALDSTQAQRQPNMNAMYALKREFIIRLIAQPEVKKVEYANTVELYNVFDTNVDGILLQIGVTLLDKASVC